MRTLAETFPIGNIVHESKIWIRARYAHNELTIGARDGFDGH